MTYFSTRIGNLNMISIKDSRSNLIINLDFFLYLN